MSFHSSITNPFKFTIFLFYIQIPTDITTFLSLIFFTIKLHFLLTDQKFFYYNLIFIIIFKGEQVACTRYPNLYPIQIIIISIIMILDPLFWAQNYLPIINYSNLHHFYDLNIIYQINTVIYFFYFIFFLMDYQYNFKYLFIKWAGLWKI